MQSGPFTITAPALGALGHSEAEVLGSVTWLWMHTPGHRDLPLHALNKLVLPALKTQQFILASAPDGDAMRPVAYLAWANFSADAESTICKARLRFARKTGTAVIGPGSPIGLPHSVIPQNFARRSRRYYPTLARAHFITAAMNAGYA